jgi:hypothetical protein
MWSLKRLFPTRPSLQRVLLRRQCLFESRGIDRECRLGACVNCHIDRAVRQGKEIDLRVPRENQADIQKAVGRFIGVASVEGKRCLTEPRDCAHDAVRLEDADFSARPKRSGHVAEGLCFQGGVGLDELRAGEPDAAGSREG